VVSEPFREGPPLGEGSRRALAIRRELDQLDEKLEQLYRWRDHGPDPSSRRRHDRRIERIELRTFALLDELGELCEPEPAAECACGGPIYDQYSEGRICRSCRTTTT
jgi:hypothetical protein